jgi:hypothetical protein
MSAVLETGIERRVREEGDAALSAVYDFIGRFVAYPSEHAHVAHALWIAHTHAMDAWDSTPRIAFLSPEPGSGKSRALEVTELLVPRAVEAVNVTAPYLFRKVGSQDGRPTILYDEIDTVFGPRAKDNEEIRGLLNAGHRKRAVAGRCVVRGKEVFTEEIPAYCAVALAGLGNLPDTILTRSVVVRMRRRAPTERVDPYRRRDESVAAERIVERLARWMETIAPELANARPVMPAGIADRNADVWESLLAIADAAGGVWPGVARAAAVTLVTEAMASTPSLGVRLLADIKAVFREAERLATKTLLSLLIELDESPWADLRGRPLDARRLAAMLRPYDVRPHPIRIGVVVDKGYTAADFSDAWARYIGPPPMESVTTVTQVTAPEHVTGVTDFPYDIGRAA